MRLLSTLLLFCSLFALRAQVSVHGRVLDARSREALAFVPLNIVGTTRGTVCDIDGRFRLELPALPTTLRLSYVGYAPKEVVVQDTKELLILLDQASTVLSEVVVDGSYNPAHRIIKLALLHRKENDGMRYRSYRYTSYSRNVFTAAMDSLRKDDPTDTVAQDSSVLEMAAFLDKQHLLLMESATKRAFIPPSASKEEVLAMRVSGLKDPSLLALAAQTSTFSIYDPLISISGKDYLGPIGQGSWNKYRFTLEDTLMQGADSVFVISYRPRKGRKFDALKGSLYINTDGWAVQNVIAEPAEREGVSVKFQQLHERVPTTNGAKEWFPVQLNTFIYMDNVQMNGAALVGEGSTYLRGIELDAEVARKEVRGPEIVADRLESRRDETYWAALRNEPLEGKDLRTYAFMDSLGEAVKLDQKVKWFSALLTGRLRMGHVDLLLEHILRYNGYEGFRLGGGLSTNERLSRYFSVGGYFGYGFADERWKYGGDLTIRPVPGRNLHLKASYENDVVETGGVAFLGAPGELLSQERLRLFYMDRMDRIERQALTLHTRVGGTLGLWLGTERALRVNAMGYRYSEPLGEGITRFRNTFTTGAFTAELRWALGEKWARLPGGERSLGTRFPVVHVQAFRAVDGLYDGDVDTWRVNAMVEKTFHIKLVGNLSVRALCGVADPHAPMPFLFNLRGVNADGLLAASENVFETMQPNEFLADLYAAFHLRHNFGNLLIKTKKFHPEPSLVYNAGIGELSEPGLHQGLPFAELSGVFHEAGLRVDRIYSALGVGVFYRFGPMAFREPAENLAVKLAMAFSF